MGLAVQGDKWHLSDELWAKMKPLLPPRKVHPLGCHNPRVPDRQAMEAILFVLSTGCQWNALNSTGICTSSSAHHRFVEWINTGVFKEFWRQGLLAYNETKGINWDWLVLDGAMTKAPLGAEKIGPNPTDRAKGGVKRSLLTEANGIPIALVIDGVNRHDMKLLAVTLLGIMIDRPMPAHGQKWSRPASRA